MKPTENMEAYQLYLQAKRPKKLPSQDMLAGWDSLRVELVRACGYAARP